MASRLLTKSLNNEQRAKIIELYEAGNGCSTVTRLAYEQIGLKISAKSIRSIVKEAGCKKHVGGGVAGPRVPKSRLAALFPY
jgi:transposase